MIINHFIFNKSSAFQCVMLDKSIIESYKKYFNRYTS